MREDTYVFTSAPGELNAFRWGWLEEGKTKMVHLSDDYRKGVTYVK